MLIDKEYKNKKRLEEEDFRYYLAGIPLLRQEISLLKNNFPIMIPYKDGDNPLAGYNISPSRLFDSYGRGDNVTNSNLNPYENIPSESYSGERLFNYSGHSDSNPTCSDCLTSYSEGVKGE